MTRWSREGARTRRGLGMLEAAHDSAFASDAGATPARPGTNGVPEATPSSFRLS
jgi:hypothetical protein